MDVDYPSRAPMLLALSAQIERLRQGGVRLRALDYQFAVLAALRGDIEHCLRSLDRALEDGFVDALAFRRDLVWQRIDVRVLAERERFLTDSVAKDRALIERSARGLKRPGKLETRKRGTAGCRAQPARSPARVWTAGADTRWLQPGTRFPTRYAVQKHCRAHGLRCRSGRSERSPALRRRIPARLSSISSASSRWPITGTSSGIRSSRVNR